MMTKLLTYTILKINEGVSSVLNYYNKSVTDKSYREAGKKLNHLNEALPKSAIGNHYSVSHGGFLLKISLSK